MMILDKPYVSKFLENSLIDLQIPVLKSKVLEELKISSKINIIEEKEFIGKKYCSKDCEKRTYSHQQA